MTVPNRKSTKATVHDFLMNTSIGALPQAYGTSMIFLKLMWLVVFIAGLFGMCYHSYVIVTRYRSYPLQVKVSLKTNDTLEFPAVTVCSLNPIKKSKVGCGTLQQLINVQDNVATMMLKDKELQKLFIQKKQERVIGRKVKMIDWIEDIVYAGSHDEKSGEACKQKNSTKNATVVAAKRKKRELLKSTTAAEETTTEQSFMETESTTGSNSENEDASSPSDSQVDEEYDFDNYNIIDNYYYGSSDTDGAENEASTVDPYGDDEDGDMDEEDIFIEEMENLKWMDDFKEEDKFAFKRFVRNSKLKDLQDVIDLVSLTPKEYQMMGYTRDFIVECTYDREDCNIARDFHHDLNKKYGNCFTFNSGIDGRKPNRTRKSGSQFGLRLTLNIESKEYLGLLASEYGVRVSIHETGTKPLPEDDGFVAPPGVLTSVAVGRKEVLRLEHPFESNCTTNFPKKYKLFADKSTYSIRHCRLACLDHHLFEECGCVEQLKGHTTAHPRCDLFNKQHRNCRARIHARMALEQTAKNSINCDCSPNCHDVLFKTGISQTRWPSDAYRRLKMVNFYGTHRLSRLFFKSALEEEEGFTSENLARLHIYYQSLTYEIILEQPAYPMSQLWADFGGIIGLYLGMSAVTAVEVVQLVILIFTGCFNKKNAADQKVDPDHYPPVEPSPDRDAVYTGKYNRNHYPGVPHLY